MQYIVQQMDNNDSDHFQNIDEWMKSNENGMDAAAWQGSAFI